MDIQKAAKKLLGWSDAKNTKKANAKSAFNRAKIAGALGGGRSTLTSNERAQRKNSKLLYKQRAKAKKGGSGPVVKKVKAVQRHNSETNRWIREAGR